MNLVEMFADSVHLADLREDLVTMAAEGSIDTGAVIFQAQCCVNAFIGCIGQYLVSNFVADTVLLSEAASTDTVKIFSIGISLYNRGTHKHRSYLINFKLVTEQSTETSENGDSKMLSPGLYLDLP